MQVTDRPVRKRKPVASSKGGATREKIVATAQELILDKGFAGMTLDHVLRHAGLTKGAFFHHFSGKADLARAVVERFADNDFQLMREWSERADRLSDDPLERLLIFLRLFEEFLDRLGGPFHGCIFAAYTYENEQFAPEIHAFIRRQFEAWIRLNESKIEALIEVRPPARPVTARQIAELIVSTVEGGIVMAKALDDATWLQRQSAQCRNYLEMLFDARA